MGDATNIHQPISGELGELCQELWWDLAKAFVVPVPLTGSELEPHKQRICRPGWEEWPKF
jgi:hypothetical protein